MTRRDYTNASGYFCPTENTAIYIDDITIKAKGDSGRYKTVGPARTIERVEV